MTIRLYMVEDSMGQRLAQVLRARNVDVQKALDADMIERPDEDHWRMPFVRAALPCEYSWAAAAPLHCTGAF